MKVAIVPVGCPFPVEHLGGILPLKVSSQSLLKGSAEQHGCPSVFLFPAIEITMLVAARAGQILANLGVAIGHEDTSDPDWSEPGSSLSLVIESSSLRAAGAKPSR